MPNYASYLNTLAESAHPEGGWGYAPDQAAHLEPTCLAMLALSLDAQTYAAPLARAQQFLQSCAAPDGTYRLGRGRTEAVWPTALVLFTRTALGAPTEELKRSAARLLTLRGKIPTEGANEDLHDINLKLIGWPWAEGNFSWAEPTAWACLALRRCGQGKQQRVQEGLQLLLDRAADEGGINYGNRRILGRITEPIPGPTALMLLALQGRAQEPRVAAAVRYLQKAVVGCNDLEHLCWARLALALYRELPDVPATLQQLSDAIQQGQQTRADTPWVRPAYLRIALSALALAAEERNVFALPDEAALAQQLGNIQPAAEMSSKPSLGQKIGAFFRGLTVKAVGQMRQLTVPAQVHIARAASYDDDLVTILAKQFEHFRNKVPLAGKRVVLKPNLVEYHRDKVINTNPRVIAAVIELCRQEGAKEIIVAEGPGHWRNVEFLVSESGLGEVLSHYKVPFIDLNHDEPVKMPNLGQCTGLEYIYLSRTIATAEVVISLPKLKTHHWAGATLSLKNLFGTLPGICYGWPKNELHWRGIHNSIVDIALTRTPDLAIVDGIIGMEGDGPLNGTAKQVGALVMGNDLLAVDATCCRLMQLEPEKIGYLVLGYQKKLGCLRVGEIQQLGESIASLAQPFTTVEHFKELCVGRSA